MRTIRPLLGLATTFLAVGLIGCSAGANSELSYDDSPRSKYFSGGDGASMSDEDLKREIEKEHLEREEAMAQCMAGEGFEYIPTSANVMVGNVSEVEWEPDDKGWVEKYGYGLINDPYNAQENDWSEEDAYSDPNEGYVDSLTESARAAYYEAAYGPVQAEGEEYEYSWETAGCQGWAEHELVKDRSDPWSADEFADLRERLDTFWTGLETAPVLKDLNAAWAGCMDEKGEPGFASPRDAESSISDQQSEMYNTSELGEEAAEGVVEDAFNSPEMKKLGEREIELALIDLECRTKVSYTAESLRIRFAEEERFIAENKKDLEAFKLAMDQAN